MKKSRKDFEGKESNLTRREFIKTTAIGTGVAVAGISPLAAVGAEKKKSAGLAKRTLGRTGLEVTDISFGSVQGPDASIVLNAVEKGINLLQTCSGYSGGKSIRAFGEAMKTLKGKRDKIYLALKQSPRAEAVEADLKTLNTDYVDILIPGLHSEGAIANPRLKAGFEQLKKAGKIRFAGFAVHKNHAKVIKKAAEVGFYDVMLVAYNARNKADLDPVIAEAKKKQNIGFMVMKSVRALGSDPEVVAAGMKKLLSNKNVDTLLIGMPSFQEIEKNVAISGKKLSMREEALLQEHLRLASAVCTQCGDCSICPNGVEIADIYRFKMYYEERGEKELALHGYRSLAPAQTAANCNDCGACEKVCPKALPIMKELREAEMLLA